MIEFEEFPKVPRLFRDVIITEKIDGTNAAVVIEEHLGLGKWATGERVGEQLYGGPHQTWRGITVVDADGNHFMVGAQSRKRLVTPDVDNFGFAKWVFDNAADLVHILGPGRHFGEWWGSGIQRKYGLTGDDKRFSLFNVNRYAEQMYAQAILPELDVVPVLYDGPFEEEIIRDTVDVLRERGSAVAPGFMKPEGIVVYHTAAGHPFKVTLENDETPKGLVS